MPSFTRKAARPFAVPQADTTSSIATAPTLLENGRSNDTHGVWQPGLGVGGHSHTLAQPGVATPGVPERCLDEAMPDKRKRSNDRTHQPRAAWRGAARAGEVLYTLESADLAQVPKPPAELRTSNPCAIGDVILTRPVLSSDRRRLAFTWRVTARSPADEPFAARLTVVPARLAAARWTRAYR
jgi:hypothetical protein